MVVDSSVLFSNIANWALALRPFLSLKNHLRTYHNTKHRDQAITTGSVPQISRFPFPPKNTLTASPYLFHYLPPTLPLGYALDSTKV